MQLWGDGWYLLDGSHAAVGVPIVQAQDETWDPDEIQLDHTLGLAADGCGISYCPVSLMP